MHLSIFTNNSNFIQSFFITICIIVEFSQLFKDTKCVIMNNNDIIP